MADHFITFPIYKFSGYRKNTSQGRYKKYSIEHKKNNSLLAGNLVT